MSQQQRSRKKGRSYWRNLSLAAVAGQVGCVTLVIVLAAVFGGLWLDARFQTRPLFTVGLVIASIPISVVVMVAIARSITSKMVTGSPGEGMQKSPRDHRLP